jgi:integrase/recombinase XerD
METRSALELFLQEKTAQNLSSQTIKTYRFHVEHFLAFADPAGEDEDIDVCCETVYYHYLLYLQHQPHVRDVTANSYARSVKVFLNWIIKKEKVDLFDIKLPKYQKKIPATYSKEEIAMLVQKPTGTVSEIEYMTWVMINVLLSTGIRLQSLRSIHVKDVLFDTKKIIVNNTKNDCPIMIPPNEELFSILMEYIVRTKLTGDDFLFCTAMKTQYATRSVEDFINRYEEHRQITKDRSVHAFRHTFAKNFYQETHDSLALMKILGHKDLAQTQRYLESLGFGIEERITYNPRALVRDNEIAAKQTRRERINMDDTVALPALYGNEGH